ncbi:uncharacterized protein LOC120348053 [Styela clava]
MTIGRTNHPYVEEVVPEGRRLRMKDWLKSRIGNPRYPGLVWLDEEKKIFRIPWKHAALHGWDQNCDGALFRDWAEHTGACNKNTHPKQLKATFRCALHSLPDVHEERNLAKKRGDDACRVFKMEPTSYVTNNKRRHIRIRNHKERKSNIKQQQQKGECFEQYHLPVHMQPNSMPFSTWNESPYLPGEYQTCNYNNNFLYPESENGDTIAFRSPDHFSVSPRRWTTQSNPDITTRGLLPPQIEVSHDFQPSYDISVMSQMQHSQSVPEISQQTHFSGCQNMRGMQTLPVCSSPLQVYQHSNPKNEISGQNEISYYQSTNMGPMSPGVISTSSYTPMVSSPTSFSSVQAVGIHSMSSPNRGSDTIAQAVASASAVIESYQAPNQFSNCPSYPTPNMFREERLINPVDAILASGAVRVSEDRPTEILRTSHQAVSNLPTTMMSEINLSFKEYQQTPNKISSLENQIAGMCQPTTFMIDQSGNQQMLNGVAQGGLSPHQSEYIEGCDPTGQFITENQSADNTSSEWMSSPQHESILPSASTLLSSSSSPTSATSPLQWISSNEKSIASPSANFFDDIQYDALSTASPTYTYDNMATASTQYNDNLSASFTTVSTTTQHHLSTSMYGGYASQ